MELSLILLWLGMASFVTSAFVFHPRYSSDSWPEQQLEEAGAVYRLDDLLQHHLRSRSKRTTKRRCGSVLIMDVLKVCNGRLASPPEKRSLYSKAKTVKRSLTEICCQRPCSESDLEAFCEV